MKIIILMVLALSGFANAKQIYYNEILGKVPAGVWTFKCQTCHSTSNPRALNTFGRDFAKLMRESITQQVTREQTWVVLLNLDSDNDKISNNDEILCGSNPGVESNQCK